MVERSFGRKKNKWAILSNTIPHQLIASGQFTKIYRIIAAIDNCFCEKLYTDNPDHDIQLRNVQTAHLKNTAKLSKSCESRNWQVQEFSHLKRQNLVPKFNVSDLTPNICGVYAYGLSRGYLNKAEKLAFQTNNEVPGVVRVTGNRKNTTFFSVI